MAATASNAGNTSSRSGSSVGSCMTAQSGFHAATEHAVVGQVAGLASTSMSPATSSGYCDVKVTDSGPPKEWPTMTYGPGSPASSSSSWRSVAWVSNVCVVDGGVARSGAEPCVGADPGIRSARVGSMAPQLSPPSPHPAMSSTVVSPLPLHRRCIRPLSIATSSSTRPSGRSMVVVVDGGASVAGVALDAPQAATVRVSATVASALGRVMVAMSAGLGVQGGGGPHGVDDVEDRLAGLASGVFVGDDHLVVRVIEHAVHVVGREGREVVLHGEPR